MEDVPSREEPPPRPAALQLPSSWKKMQLETNLYRVKRMKQSYEIYQYDMVIEPEIGDERLLQLRQLIHKNKNIDHKLKDLKIMSFKGKTVWASQKSEKTVTINIAKNIAQGILDDYSITFRLNRAISYYDIAKLELKQRREVLQVYTVALKEKMQLQRMVETTRGRFFSKEEENTILLQKYMLKKNYQLKFSFIKNSLSLMVDVGYRVFKRDNVFQQLKVLGNNQDAQRQLVKNKIVITTYTNRTYKIDGIDFTQHPCSQIPFKYDKCTNYLEYFVYRYNQNKQDIPVNQPLLRVIQKYQYTNREGQGKVKEPVYIFLVPSLCRFSAVLEKTDFQAKAIIKMKPTQRIKQQNTIIDIINKQGGWLNAQIDTQSVRALGYKYQVNLMVGKDKKSTNLYNGSFSIGSNRQNHNIGHKIRRDQWIVVYSSRTKESEINQFIQKFTTSGENFNLKIEQPQFLFINEKQNKRAEDWVFHLENAIWDRQLRESLKCVVFILRDKCEYNFYGELKRLTTLQLRIPSQMIRNTGDTLFNLSKLGKIALQVCAKTGVNLWKVNHNPDSWKNQRVISGAFAVTKNTSKKVNAPQYVLSFVGTLGDSFSQCFSESKMVRAQQLNKVQIYQQIFRSWLKIYKHDTGSFPHVIVLYRQGLNEKERQRQCHYQIQALQNIRKSINAYSNDKIYHSFNPQLCTKRVYLKNGSPQAGTIVLDTISENNTFDFYLAPQATARDCTNKLTRFVVLYYNHQLSQDTIVNYTMEQCYNYPNWQGGIRTPACLQGAIKLSKLVAEHFQCDVNMSKIKIADLQKYDINVAPSFL